jgi:hypothetical protein
MTVRRPARMWAIAWLAVVFAALLTPTGAALAKSTATHASSTAPTQTVTSASSAAATPTVPAPSTGPLSGGITAPGGVPTASSTTPTIISPTTSTSGSSSLSGGSAIGIAVGAFVVLGGIAFFIWRDARRRAPVAARTSGSGEDGGNRPGSRAPPKARKLSAAERKRRKRGRAKR